MKCNKCKTKLGNDNWHQSLKAKNSKICKKCHLKDGQKWRKENRERSNKMANDWYKKNKEKARKTVKKSRKKLRNEILCEYGGQCVSCGISNKLVLDIDHIKNDGNKDRKTGIYGKRLMYKIKREGFPKDKYQLLCRNCNWLKHLKKSLIKL